MNLGHANKFLCLSLVPDLKQRRAKLKGSLTTDALSLGESTRFAKYDLTAQLTIREKIKNLPVVFFMFTYLEF